MFFEIALVLYHISNSGILWLDFNRDFYTYVRVTDCPKFMFMFIFILLFENICVFLLLGRHFNIFSAGFWVICWSDKGLELTKNDRLLAPPRQAASVQPPALSRLIHELKPTSSGLYPIKA